MPTEILRTLDDGRPAEVRILVPISLSGRTWRLEETDTVEVAAGGALEWAVAGLGAGERAHIRVVSAEPLAPDTSQVPIPYPFEAVERSGDTIRASVSRRARGRYRYEVDVEFPNGDRVPLDCSPAEMGGVDVSGPPTGA
jgi:hypothetical protein